MVSDEELLSQIKAREQEIAMARYELHNRQNVLQHIPKETMVQKAFKMFNDLTKPKQRIGMGSNGIVPDRNEELDYFKKLLRKRDIEIKKQKHMITKMNAPKIYIKKEFMDGKNIMKKKISPQVGLRSSTRKDRESALPSRQSRAGQSPTTFRRKEAWLK